MGVQNTSLEHEIGKMKNSIVKMLGVAGVGATCAAVVIFGAMCAYKINPGYAGVVYNMDGGIEDVTLGQGFHMVAPWKNVTEYPVSTETVYYTKGAEDGDDADAQHKDQSINVNTKDGKQVNVSVTYAYHMDASMLPAVFEKFRGQPADIIEDGYIKNEMYQAINEVTSQYSLMDLVGDKRPEINAKIYTMFHDSLQEYGIIIETFNLSDVVPDEATKEAIQNVVNAQNALEQAKIEKEKAEVEAQKKVAEAKGVADSMLIKAKAEADSNAMINSSLNGNIIELKKIDKWDGKLPQYTGMDGTIMIKP